METGATGNRRFNRIGSGSKHGRFDNGRITEIAPSEAVAANESSTGSDSRAPQRDAEDDRDRPPARRYGLAAETQLALMASGTEQGQPPAPTLAPLRAYRNAGGEPADTPAADPPGKLSRTV